MNTDADVVDEVEWAAALALSNVEQALTEYKRLGASPAPCATVSRAGATMRNSAAPRTNKSN